MDKADKFTSGMNNVDNMAANKALTDDNYSADAALKLAADIMETLRPHIEKNIGLVGNWRAADYDARRDFVKGVLDLLLQKYPSRTVKPEIYFLEDLQAKGADNIPALEGTASCFFEKNFVPYYAQQARDIFGNDGPFFAFFHDLSDPFGMIGQIVHEFTHYLQATGQSTIKPEIVKEAGKYYKLSADNPQINKDSIFEVEAHAIGGYAREQEQNLYFAALKQRQSQHDI